MIVDQAFDLGTPHGRAMARMLAVFAEYERELISERTKAALAVKRAQGVPIGRPRSMDEDVRKRIKQMRANGMGLSAIAEVLNANRVQTARGGRCWYPSTVRQVVSTVDS